MGGKVNLTINNDLSELETISAAVEELGDENGFSPKLVFNLNLVLEEIITNIVSYAYSDHSEHHISVDIEWDDEKVSLCVRDDGKAFDPLALPEPDTDAPLEERKIGGLGVYFVRKVMDHVEYRWEGGYNILMMTKKT